MVDRRIYPTELQVGDWISSDPRRDFYVASLDFDDSDVIVNAGRPDQIRIDRRQTVTVLPSEIAAVVHPASPAA